MFSYIAISVFLLYWKTWNSKKTWTIRLRYNTVHFNILWTQINKSFYKNFWEKAQINFLFILSFWIRDYETNFMTL